MTDTPAPLPTPTPKAPDAPEQPANYIAPHLNFWQQPWVQTFLPLGTSLAIHLGIIILALLLAKTVDVVYKNVVQEQVIIPDATIIEGAEAGGIPNPGLGGDPTRAAKQDTDPTVPMSSAGTAAKASQALTSSLMGGGQGDQEKAADSIIGIGAAQGLGRGTGAGSGQGVGTGSGNSDSAGAVAAFGVPGGGGGVGPKFMKVGSGNARTIAYVCDASGSMQSKRELLFDELKRAIDGLRPTQAFNVIFFNDPDKKPQTIAAQLLMAVPDNKRKAYDFLDPRSAQSPTFAGSTDPIPGLEMAFKQKPQLIYLLTDGDFPDNAKVEKKVSELYKAAEGKVKVNTIAFVGSSDTDKDFINVLTKIAKDTGGLFRRVTEDDVR